MYRKKYIKKYPKKIYKRPYTHKSYPKKTYVPRTITESPRTFVCRWVN